MHRNALYKAYKGTDQEADVMLYSDREMMRQANRGKICFNHIQVRPLGDNER